MKFGIVVSEFNPQLSEALLESCLRGFEEQGIKPDVYKVHGALKFSDDSRLYPAKTSESGCGFGLYY